MLAGVKKWAVVAGMAVTAAAVLLAGGIASGVLSDVAPALAQEEPVEDLPSAPWPGPRMGRGGCDWVGGSWTMFDAAAEALGLTPDEFFAESHAGKSLAEIAEQQGVDMQTVYDAMQATQAEAMRAAIAQAVEDGSLTQEHANWLLQGLDQGFFPGGRGFGPGTEGMSIERRGNAYQTRASFLSTSICSTKPLSNARFFATSPVLRS
jgi:hypothetical protein